MKICTCCSLLIWSVVLCIQCKVSNASLDFYNMKIINRTHSIEVSWEKPDKRKSPLCYRTDLQYRSQCDTSWKNYTNISGFSFLLPAPNMKSNYAFRIRMMLCTKTTRGSWSPVKYWKHETDFIQAQCITEKSSFTVQNYLLILFLAAFILFCAITHNRVRRFVLPIIPDPRNIPRRIFDFEQTQFWKDFAQTYEDFKVSEIKICEAEEEMNGITLISDLEEQSSPPLPVHTVPGKQDFSTNTSTYTIYSSATTEDNNDAQCQTTRPDYIFI